MPGGNKISIRGQDRELPCSAIFNPRIVNSRKRVGEGKSSKEK
jgi:hypothetical protein